MIKLNNKKITYVALADTNNSIKAPKEIWYADSSNSVKLVYRRKDALIEGEDYERYHWLCGRNGAYINTNHKLHTCYDVFDCHFKWDGETANPNGKTQGVFGCYFYQGANCWARVAIAYDLFYVNYFKFVNWNTIPINGVNDVEIKSLMSSSDSGNYSFTLNGVTHEYSNNGLANTETNADVLLFENIANNGSYFHGDIASFRIYHDNTDFVNMIPCKLLKPVPKWLDANGIRRQVGECGMIDLVSGKFYGNVNSVGTFTVENYYERKEWLCGDGSAYIDTLIEDLTELNEIYCYFYSDNPSENERIFGREGLSRVVLRYSAMNSLEFFVSPSNNPQYIVLNFNREGYFHADFTTNQASTSTSEPTSFVWNTSKSGNSVILFGDHSAAVLPHTSAKIKSFKMEPFIKLIPCTLTMDLPASMDANNIARTKGTCGMWDLVSDRFYGNVANSGTFKAVNLAEGVDYEVHQWLGSASGFPYIEVQDGVNTDENAYIETTYKCNYSNGGFDMVVGFSINQDSNIGIRIFNATYGTAYGTYVDYHKTVNGVLSSCRMVAVQSNINAERYIKATLNNLIIDTTEYSSINWGSGFDNVNYLSTRLLGNQDNNNVMYKRTKIRANFKEYDLVPCKLLKSIPAKYDGNGIARQAGECGMYDTVSGKFFGNVANRGTFSVSD